MSDFVPALQRTQNFFELYQYICGKSEVPAVYNFWSSVALLAAVIEDNVWYEKHRDSKLFSNLYIFLIGPGGLGKGTAISTANNLCDFSVICSKYRGSATSASLIDILGKVEKDEWGRKSVANPHLWLVMDELKNNVGTNVPLVEAFISLMTELYTATGYTMSTSTRKYGRVDVNSPVVNWLCGTTESDLRGILTRKLIDSGFTARACFIFGVHDFNVRYPDIIYPPDYDEVKEFLKARLWMIQQTKGPMVMSEAAEVLKTKWYMTRPNPEDEALYSTWRRQDDMLIKFAMICCMADGKGLTIQSWHLEMAKAMVNASGKFAAKLLEVAHETRDTKVANDLESYVKRKKTIAHSKLLNYGRSKGMDGRKTREAIWSLIQEGLVKATRNGKGAVFYEWIN